MQPHAPLGHLGHGPHVPAAAASAHDAHEPAADALIEFELAYDAARPAPGGRVVEVALEARETGWQYDPRFRTRAWGYNGQVPGPVIDANVGDVLEVTLRNSRPPPSSCWSLTACARLSIVTGPLYRVIRLSRPTSGKP